MFQKNSEWFESYFRSLLYNLTLHCKGCQKTSYTTARSDNICIKPEQYTSEKHFIL